MRNIKVAAAQLGPIQRAGTRQVVVARLLDLMRQAKGCDLIVYPELTLTAFFPRWYSEDRSEADIWFEREMPSAATRSLFEEAKRGHSHEFRLPGTHAGRTPLQHLDTGRQGGVRRRQYRKVYPPGHDEFDPKRTRRPRLCGVAPARRRVRYVHLQRPGLAGDLPRARAARHRNGGAGFNTPSVNPQNGNEGLAKRVFHHKLSLQAGAYQNSTWVIAVAKCGIEDGHHCMAGSMIINPDGEIVAETMTEDDELLVHDCDLDATRFGKETMFDFARHRCIEHYGLIATQIGVVTPKG
jgi:N-carbamoyl-D-amino-acid hydrolase